MRRARGLNFKPQDFCFNDKRFSAWPTDRFSILLYDSDSKNKPTMYAQNLNRLWRNWINKIIFFQIGHKVTAIKLSTQNQFFWKNLVNNDP